MFLRLSGKIADEDTEAVNECWSSVIPLHPPPRNPKLQTDGRRENPYTLLLIKYILFINIKIYI